ncbi:UNVERIFIED_CONTAM: hypothetical protein HDU68_010138 [Siphonaria sp. JEL0065]|nr:hypothetical protein HDU68_010138 [Siphonaria sp. JEL0065]
MNRSVDVSVFEVPAKTKAKRQLDRDFELLFNGKEAVQTRDARRLLNAALWKTAKEGLEAKLVCLNEEALTRIQAFVLAAHTRKHIINLPVRELPTALIQGDNQHMYDTLASRLQQNPNCHVAVLRPLNSSDLKSCVKSLILQFMSSGNSSGSNSNSTRDPIALSSSSNLDLDQVDQYDDEDSSPSKKKKRRRNTKEEDELLDAINHGVDEDYEDPNEFVVLSSGGTDDDRSGFVYKEDLVKMCSSLKSLPFVFLLGISTTLDVVHNNFDKSVLGLLCCERFWLSKSDHIVDAVVEEIFLKHQAGVKLNHDAFSLIFNSYKSNHRSIAALTDTIQYFFLGHFYGNSLSSLMNHDGKTPLQPEMMHRLRTRDSFQRHLTALYESKQDEEIHHLLFNDSHLLQALGAARINIEKYHFMMSFSIHFLRSTKALLKLNSQNAIYNIYSRVLSSDDFVKEAFVQEIVRKLKWVKPTELAGVLNLWLGLFQECGLQEAVATHIEAIQTLLAEFNQKYKPDSDDERGDGNESETDIEAEERRFQKAHELTLQGRRTKAALKAGVMGPDIKSYDFFALRSCQIFESFLGQTMKHHTEYLFNEVYYYEEPAKTLMKNFQPHPRPITQIALGAASDYLTCQCCKSSDVLHSGALDISLLYKLHSECAHMINLYDFFTSFELILLKESPRPSKADIQARFAAGLTHLEYMGFIKPTIRKTDHVLKMTASFL